MSHERDVTDSDQNTEGSMGVSSEREGPTGPGQFGTTGVRPTGVEGAPDDEADVPPEQRPGQVEENPDGLPPKQAPPEGHDRQL